jgi:hypothetical protein
MVLAVALGALILCWPAFLNGFPLVFSDTGNYIGQAMLRFIGWNAPPFYSVFLLATDLRLTLWTPILVQGLTVASLLSIALDRFDLRGPWPVLAACGALSVFTGLPWATSLLIPDVYTGVAALSLALLAFGGLAVWQRVYLLPLASFAVAVHQSHIPVAFGLLAVGCAIRWWQDGSRAALRAARGLAPAPVFAAALVFSVNLLGLGLPSISPFGTIVLAARMIGDGTGLAYLRASCPTEHHRICGHLEEIGPGGYLMLWAMPELWSEMGGHRAWAPEAGRIVRGTIAYTPGAVIAAALGNGVRQLAAMRTGVILQPWTEADADGPRPMVARFFPGELAAFDRSRQQSGELLHDVEPFAALHVAVAWLGSAGLLACIWISRRDRAAFGLCAMVLLAVVGNAFVTGALSGVEDRYAGRVAWLLVFAPGLVLARRIRTAAVRGLAPASVRGGGSAGVPRRVPSPPGPETP